MSEHWREKLRRIAEKRATVEAFQSYHIGEGRALPFNYRWEHVQAVVGLALRLARTLEADGEIVEAAAWLHDVCKLDEPHEITGAEEAARLLLDSDFPQEKIPAVVHAILVHRGMARDAGADPLEPVEAAILWDADKLSKLGVQSLIYNVSAPYANGYSMQGRREQLSTLSQEVLERTVASMNTEPGRRLAERRYEEMMQALEVWRREEEEQNA